MECLQVGACKINKRALLMIKPSKPPQGAKEKPYNRASPVENAPLLPTAPPPEGEVLAALYFVMLMRKMLLCDLLCPRLRGKGGAVRHQRGRAAEGSSFLRKEAKHYRTVPPLSFRAERSGVEKSPGTMVPVVSGRYVSHRNVRLLSQKGAGGEP